MLQMREKTMIRPFILAVLALVVLFSGSKVCADDEPYIQSIDVEPFGYYAKSWPPAIGCDVQRFLAIVHMSDGSIATTDELRQMDWKIERYDNISKTYTVVQTDEGEEIGFWQPYGTDEGQYKVTATSKADPDASGYTWYQLHYPAYTETFCICKPGTVKYGDITTSSGDIVTGEKRVKKIIGAKDIEEIYDWDTKKYTCILPENPYLAKDYTFTGWKKIGGKDDKKIFRPGSKYVSPARGSDGAERNAYFEAQWKPNFKKPDLVANKAGKKKIKLSWNRMIGGRGYKIYRSTKKTGKYKHIKTIKNKLKTAWTDKRVKRGKTYYYKVAAYKKGKQRKSEWVQTSTKAAKVKNVRINAASLSGTVGKSTKLKAKVKAVKGRTLSKKVRWYTSNKKIAKISVRTGKVTFRAAGKCQIWAKAYNGKNSRRINVSVS